MLEARLKEFKETNQLVTVGAMGTALVVTRRVRLQPYPIDSKTLLSPSGGQVAGLSGAAINKILLSHGVTNRVGTESGRTSRGTPDIARYYAAFLNELKLDDDGLEIAEKWWVDRFKEFFATEPFQLKYDASKTLKVFIEAMLEQALSRQKLSPGKKYVGAMLQHLIGAKLALALPEITIGHHGFEVADAVSSRSGDFVIDDAILHVTTAPVPSLIDKCQANLNAGLRPIILTLPKSIGSAESQAEQAGMDGRIEVLDAVQFLAANLYEISLFKGAARKVTVENLAKKYNEIVEAVESDASLVIALE
ncbi:DUF4928 family protein [Caballeronia sordidicola]|uniref:DUF4928 family protein n=1 Tax=Caballeronia sordidicola TaxID=196367 RepID=UPI000A3C9DA4|nr:DUF4928 family protein [Caballeronia sordidicola]